MRFGSSAAEPAESSAGRELFVRHARKDGRLVAVLRAVDQGESCIVEAEVYPHGSTQLTRPGRGGARRGSARRPPPGPGCACYE